VFTSFPELIVILVAIFAVGKSSGDQIGIGTIFGEPFMASSLAYSAVLAAVVIAYVRKRRKDMSMHLDRDLFLPFLFTAIIFPVLVIPVFFLNRAVQDITGTALILLYILYFIISARKRMSLEENEGGNLLLAGIVKPWIGSVIQISLSALGLYAGSVILVSSIENIATLYSISPLSLAILIVPVATILPETMSAFIWAYKGKGYYSHCVPCRGEGDLYHAVSGYCPPHNSMGGWNGIIFQRTGNCYSVCSLPSHGDQEKNSRICIIGRRDLLYPVRLLRIYYMTVSASDFPCHIWSEL
jgi:Ca2+/Na+ antiporter